MDDTRDLEFLSRDRRGELRRLERRLDCVLLRLACLQVVTSVRSERDAVVWASRAFACQTLASLRLASEPAVAGAAVTYLTAHWSDGDTAGALGQRIGAAMQAWQEHDERTALRDRDRAVHLLIARIETVDRWLQVRCVDDVARVLGSATATATQRARLIDHLGLRRRARCFGAGLRDGEFRRWLERRMTPVQLAVYAQAMRPLLAGSAIRYRKPLASTATTEWRRAG